MATRFTHAYEMSGRILPSVSLALTAGDMERVKGITQGSQPID